MSAYTHYRRHPGSQTACQRLLQLPLAHPTRAEQELVESLDFLLREPPDAEILFPLLEQTRASLCFVQAAAVLHYLEKAPHLDTDEEAHFQRSIDAARLMMQSYMVCADLPGLRQVDDLVAGSAQARRIATVLHRCLYYSAMAIFEHYRAKRELPPGLWSQHNALYGCASRLGVATLQIDDQIFDEQRISHCQAAYVTPLLVELTGPYGRNPRDLNLIWQWAEQAAHDVQIRPLALLDPSSSPAYAVELEQDAPLRPLQLIKGRRTASQLETTVLTSHIHQILEELAAGASPERLGLYPENVENSKRLLGELESLWRLDRYHRRQPRTEARSRALICTGFKSMHHFVLATESTAACLAQLKRLDSNSSRHHTENWEIMDHGPGGYRLACQATATRLQTGQLIGLRPDNSTSYRLGQVSWVQRGQSGRLLAGVECFPGIPQAVCIRAMSQVRGQKGLFIRAFLPRSGSAGAAEPWILLPASAQFHHASLEVLYDHSWEIVLGKEIQHGSDYILMTYQKPSK